MEDGKNGKTGAEPVAGEQQKPIEAQILGQFIKDLSFENPSVGQGRDRTRAKPRTSMSKSTSRLGGRAPTLL